MKWRVELFRTLTSEVGYAEIEAPNHTVAREMAFELVRRVRQGGAPITWRGDKQVLAIGLTGVEPALEQQDRRHG